VLRGWFDALAEGGEVHMPLEKQMWGEQFGQCADRFGTTWLVTVEQAGGWPPLVPAPGRIEQRPAREVGRRSTSARPRGGR
jgi:hypothetical protein